ncbi:MAG: quinolinate synthase NadA [Deltaproteobacteria bacterium]|jgi:quinolinate synthase|nr:quinolinate synthase NadA [Deltaproteobacteria bacterium]
MICGGLKPGERKRRQAERVRLLSEALDVEILAHFYQRLDVKALARHVGGSRGLLARVAASRARAVMMCGVSFLVEAAERLRPDLSVLTPRADAGCPFSEMVGPAEALEARRARPGALLVADVKAARAVKELCDVALDPPESLTALSWPAERPATVLPALSSGDPDALPHRDWPGAECQVHRQVGPEAVRTILRQRPGALTAVNALCLPEVRALADHVGDSQSMWDWCLSCEADDVLVVGESGLVESLRAARPEKRFWETDVEVFCPNM